eukprot:TRINITY_DN2195_c0_g1_i1.p1 TRINITY_DN2195_c0_g1~~TRINITY_DN2195_c0_g1_i1.p1  ORF type:complete len:663 (+),score=118.92 TRINITY_DN2195_c0_g1_i1:63-2051(+)
MGGGLTKSENAGAAPIDENGELQTALWGTFINNILQEIGDNDPTLAVARLGGKHLRVDGARTLYTALQTNNKVNSIDVSRNDFLPEAASFIAKSLYENEHLTELRISGNPLGPDGIKPFVTPLLHNATLQKLDLRRTALSKKGCGALSEIIHFNNSLTELDISTNGIGADGAREIAAALPHSYTLARLALANNNLADKGLHHITDALTRNRSITALDVGFNNIGVPGLLYFSSMLADMACRLAHLDLSGNEIGDDGTKLLCEQLAQLGNLTSLSLRRTNITDRSCHYVGDALLNEHCQNLMLHDLDISENKITKEGIEKICDMLVERQTINQLDLTGNDFGKDGGKAVIKMLEKNTALVLIFIGNCNLSKEYVGKIQSLLRRNREVSGLPIESPLSWTISPATAAGDRARFGEEVLPQEAREEAFCEGLFRRLRNNAPDATHALLSCQYLSSQMAIDIRDGLAASSHIVHLDLSTNHLGSEGIHTIAHGLKANKTLQTLNLAANHIASDCAKDLADFLRTNTSLTSLCLADNPLRDEGSTTILSAAEGHPHLHTISLEWVKLTANSGDALAGVLKASSVLQALLLAGNQLGSGGLTSLAEGLRANKSLTQLDVAVNGIGDGGVDALISANHRRLQYIDLSQNDVSAAALDRIRSLVEQNEAQ